MSSLLWRDKLVTIPSIKHWKRHTQMHGGSRLLLQHLVCDLTGCWCPLHPSVGRMEHMGHCQQQTRAPLILSLTVLACNLGTDSKQTAACWLLWMCPVIADDVTAEWVFIVMPWRNQKVKRRHQDLDTCQWTRRTHKMNDIGMTLYRQHFTF